MLAHTLWPFNNSQEMKLGSILADRRVRKCSIEIVEAGNETIQRAAKVRHGRNQRMIRGNALLVISPLLVIVAIIFVVTPFILILAVVNIHSTNHTHALPSKPRTLLHGTTGFAICLPILVVDQSLRLRLGNKGLSSFV
ncbi:uncharacterized protein EI90DRAFT_3060843 [Cantharellus anzutake]|uniref:uncharacterized protein n=1 Tax=Cantharellus anzutake TaxID=1750568 RepID=UPI001907038E|nr:uncharacterized protein EI90DRAFT_3060843 [Cantharellus anzutake]KAF8330145.1 hypothetical protein EI90DRAFT_3060843 [Cantharellus anzutake]